MDLTAVYGQSPEYRRTQPPLVASLFASRIVAAFRSAQSTREGSSAIARVRVRVLVYRPHSGPGGQCRHIQSSHNRVLDDCREGHVSFGRVVG